MVGTTRVLVGAGGGLVSVGPSVGGGSTVLVGIGVALGATISVGTGVEVGTCVEVGIGVRVGTGVQVDDGVTERVSVEVGEAVGNRVDVRDRVAVGREGLSGGGEVQVGYCVAGIRDVPDGDGVTPGDIRVKLGEGVSESPAVMGKTFLVALAEPTEIIGPVSVGGIFASRPEEVGEGTASPPIAAQAS